jgi:hypothetical protein
VEPDEVQGDTEYLLQIVSASGQIVLVYNTWYLANALLMSLTVGYEEQRSYA